MPKFKGAIKNPLSHGICTHSYKGSKGGYWPCGYNYRNELKTIHPDYNWVKYVAYVVVAEQRGEKATRAGYFKIKYHNPHAYATNVSTWNAIANAGYIKWNPSKRTYVATPEAIALMDILEEQFNVIPHWNR